jgi:two-component system CheB/CheR fusion protein
MTEKTSENGFEELLEFLRTNRGFDFSGYKRSTLNRRVRKRMEDLGITTHADYIDYLEVHPNEFTPLFNTVLINVTSFFRDPDSWEFLKNNVLTRIIESKEPEDAIRIWSAGCASGEEPYTAAMILCEMLGDEEFKRRVKLYATDVDEEALSTARLASYSAKDIQTVPTDIVEKYFIAQGDRFTFRPDIRRSVVFGKNDLQQDAPISRMDLIICRNTLMYFNAETQARILSRLHFALKPGGYLFLGKAEMIMAHSRLFTPVDLKYRIFIRRAGREAHERLAVPVLNSLQQSAKDTTQFWFSALDVLPQPTLMVDRSGDIAFINSEAREMFKLSEQDIGRPFRDLVISYRPAELRSAIDQVKQEQKPRTIRGVDFSQNGFPGSFYDITIAPIIDRPSKIRGYSIIFVDVTEYYRVKEELNQSKQELETTLEELQSSNEELETTNEELQSTVEELQTTNEELQSSNEELETMNEELQSTNDEIIQKNTQLNDFISQTEATNRFMDSVFSSVEAGILVADPNLVIRMWNARAEDLWGVRPDEAVGKRLRDLDIGLPVKDIEDRMKAFLGGDSGEKNIEIKAVNRKGKTFRCKITFNHQVDQDNKRKGVILLMEESPAE